MQKRRKWVRQEIEDSLHSFGSMPSQMDLRDAAGEYYNSWFDNEGNCLLNPHEDHQEDESTEDEY